MIPNIVRGRRVGGLLRYLYGPGRREEHVNPRLVAAWDGAGPLHQLEPQPIGPGGTRDFRKLIDLLEQPVRRGNNPPGKPVWHCSVRTHPSDRTLTDQQWAHIAGEVMAQTGLAPHGDTRAVRWVAVRHGADHIHIVATLVRQDGRTEYARNDRWRAQAACRDLEERYGLHRVGPADRTSHKRPHPVELHKARRTGRQETGRDQLRRQVRFAAAAADSVDDFFELLRRDGVLVKPRYSTTNPGQVTGYAVAVADHTTAAGQPVWYGGRRLAPDLSLPRLRSRWTDTATPSTRSGPPASLYRRATEQIRAATGEVRRLAGAAPDTAAAIGYAAADTLTAVARHVEGDRRGVLHRAGEAFDRATRDPSGGSYPRAARAEQVRAMARLLAVAGKISDEPTVLATLRLILTLSLLADALADLREAQHRLHQARAARAAAHLLRATTEPPTGTKPATATAPLTGSPTRNRDRRQQTRTNSEAGPTR